jgi:hypothetical protein
MRGLRHLLIAVSVGTAGFLLYIVATEQIHAPWIMAWFIAGCLLNAGYLAWAGPPAGKPEKSRIFGLFDLWLILKKVSYRPALIAGEPLMSDAGER